jgi:hypothetical protein
MLSPGDAWSVRPTERRTAQHPEPHRPGGEAGGRSAADSTIRRRGQALLLIVTVSLLATGARAAGRAAAEPSSGDQDEWLPLGLESYEPSAFGYTKNNDDVSFENIKISVKFPVMPRATLRHWGEANRVFFSFTGYWGFYTFTRPSAPVVGKEYNPQLFFQHEVACQGALQGGYGVNRVYGGTEHDGCYWAVGYNHDSNGQIIDSPGLYLETQRDHGTEAANDAISRGWDYIRLNGRYIVSLGPRDRLSIYPDLKYFLIDGLIQKEQEELHDWEHPPDGKERREVDGVGVLTKYQHEFGGRDTKFVLEYTTGYKDPFRYSTVRLEAGVVVLELPIVVWAEKGYVSDLAQYYRNVTGYGVQIEIGAF